MIDIKNKICQHDGCNIRANFNYKGETKTFYCLEHKLEGMINVTDKKCQHNGCEKVASCNYNGKNN